MPYFFFSCYYARVNLHADLHTYLFLYFFVCSCLPCSFSLFLFLFNSEPLCSFLNQFIYLSLHVQSLLFSSIFSPYTFYIWIPTIPLYFYLYLFTSTNNYEVFMVISCIRIFMSVYRFYLSFQL